MVNSMAFTISGPLHLCANLHNFFYALKKISWLMESPLKSTSVVPAKSLLIKGIGKGETNLNSVLYLQEYILYSAAMRCPGQILKN